MAKLADEIAKSALVDELNRVELALQQARVVAELSHAVAVQCEALDLLVARVEGFEKKLKKLQKTYEPRK